MPKEELTPGKYPAKCPITGRPFFTEIETEGEVVPTYGGPFDSYTIPVFDEQDGTYLTERYDHDLGGWAGTESIDPDDLQFSPNK